MHAALVTNIPAPYREKIHEQVASHFKQQYTVIYCQDKEPNRQWKIQQGTYPQRTLKSRMITYRGRFIHLNPDVWATLNKLNPNVIITTGFNPTMLIAFAWCKLKRRKHISMTDGWLTSEKELSIVHYAVRKMVYRFSSAFIGASKHSLDLYRYYNCSEAALFQSHLCANNALFKPPPSSIRPFDIMFSGQFIDRKMPLFFVDVAKDIKNRQGHCSVILLGSGPLENAVIERLRQANITIEFPGFVSQEDLPKYYSLAKVFLFPTQQDPWGIVANEACAAGTPVITCENAGAANDLIHHEKNGYILPLNSEIWADHVLQIISNKNLYQQFSKKAIRDVQRYSYDNAAKGIIDAIEYSLPAEK